MKLALCSSGNSLDSSLSSFNHGTSWLIFYDTQSKIIEIIPISEPVSFDTIIQLFREKNIDLFISSDFEQDLKPFLDKMKVRMVVFKDIEKKNKEIIEMFQTK
jgi:hypothetical protein